MPSAGTNSSHIWLYEELSFVGELNKSYISQRKRSQIYTNMKKIIQTSNAPSPVGPYNQAIVHNGTLYASGQIALDPETGKLVDDDIEAETHQVMRNIKAVLMEAGLTFEEVIKCSIFVSNMNDYSKINAVYATYFNEDTAPARELVEVANLPKFVNIEISIIAAMRD